MRFALFLVIGAVAGCEASTDAPCDTSEVCCCQADMLAEPVCSDGRAVCPHDYYAVDCAKKDAFCRMPSLDSGTPVDSAADSARSDASTLDASDATTED